MSKFKLVLWVIIAITLLSPLLIWTTYSRDAEEFDPNGCWILSGPLEGSKVYLRDRWWAVTHRAANEEVKWGRFHSFVKLKELP